MAARQWVASNLIAPATAKPDSSMLERAAIQAVAYSDIFDYPLMAPEIHRYLIGTVASEGGLRQLLRHGQLAPRYLSEQDGYYTLAGREMTVETRRERGAQAARLWRRATRYGQLIASLPFVRMVAVTGELAMDNVGPHSDIDYFIVTEPGRLWLSRLSVIALVRGAAPFGDVVCPNYLLSERALTIEERNLYTAHEIAQMVPLSGFDVYRRLREANRWVDEYLPNASGPPRTIPAPARARPVRSLAETALRTGPGGWLERWEMERKIRKLNRGNDRHPEASFSADWCKGHVDGHESRILTAFAERWRAIEEQLP